MSDTRPAHEFNEAHYTRSVMELSDILTVTTRKPINSRSGLRLVGEDVEINSAFFKRMLDHTMTPPFEQCLEVADGVTHDELANQAAPLLRNDLQLARMAKFVGKPEQLLQPLRQVELAPAVHFLLTLARERRPAMLEHSLRVALISTYLGIRAGQSPGQLVQLATAGLLHDIGELRFNPQLFDSNFRLSREERGQIQQHVEMSHRILQNCKAYTAVVLDAVAQHHERVDGSGYPAGLSGDGISRAGQIVALAEVASSKVCQGMWGAVRLEMICKLNRSQFDPQLLSYLSVLYGQRNAAVADQGKVSRIGAEEVHGELNKIALIFNTWRDAAARLHSKPNSAFNFIQQRLDDLNVALQDAGINLQGKQYLVDSLAADNQAMVELAQLNLEVIWQLRELMLVVQRRWSKYEADASLHGRAVASWIEAMEELLGSSGRLF